LDKGKVIAVLSAYQPPLTREQIETIADAVVKLVEAEKPMRKVIK